LISLSCAAMIVGPGAPSAAPQCQRNRGGPVTRRKLRLFLKKWKKAVQDAESGEAKSDLWEGKQAYEELQKTGFLEAVLLVKRFWEPDRKKHKDWRLRAAIRDISSEIGGYLDTQGKIVEMNSSYRQADDFLKLMSGRCEKEARQSEPRYVKEILREFAKDLWDSRRKLRREYLKEFDRPWKLRGVMASILNAHEYEKRPTREDRLDALFQIRLANLLRLSLPKPCKSYVRREVFKKGARKKVFKIVPQRDAGISRRTIARLIVLLYIVGGLAMRTKKGHLLIVHTRKKMSVLSVEERLDGAGIK
jgi:hypothetical protein